MSFVIHQDCLGPEGDEAEWGDYFAGKTVTDR
jgi:hypothetical protein